MLRGSGSSSSLSVAPGRRSSLRLATWTLAATVAALFLYRALADKAPYCVAPPPRAEHLPLTAKPMFDGKIFEDPVQLVEQPGHAGSWLVVLQRGLVERVGEGGATTTVLDLTMRVELGQQW